MASDGIKVTEDMIYAATLGNEAAQNDIILAFDKYIKGWAWKEIASGGFVGTMYGAEDLENMLRERIWLAMQQFDENKANGAVVKNFIVLCKGYMAGGMWKTRNAGHRAVRMAKQKVKKATKTEYTRNPVTRKLIATEVEVVGGVVLESVHSHSLDGVPNGDPGAYEADRLVAALKVEIDFDFNIYLAQLRDELAKKDPFLPLIFNMLWEGSYMDEIAAVVGTTSEYVQELINTELQPLVLQFFAM